MNIDELWEDDDKPSEFSNLDRISNSKEKVKKENLIEEVKEEEETFELKNDYSEEEEEPKEDIRIKLRRMRFDNI